MPALPVVPDCIKWEFLWTQLGIPCANIVHSLYSGGPPAAADLEIIGTNLWDAIQTTGILTSYTDSTVMVGIRGTDLASDTGATGESGIGASGSYDGQASPAQAAVLVNYTITRRYRGGHPRTYFPPPSAQYLASPSEWDSTAITAYNDYVTAMLASLGDLSSGSTDLAGAVCVSYVTGGSARVDPLVEPITGFVVSPILGTQRRRIRASSY